MNFDPLRPSELRHVLDAHGIRPDRRLGQNFLIDRNVRDRILTLAGITAAEGAFEVGPGAGALTLGLAETAGAVVTVELDRRLAPVLAAALGGRAHVRVVYGDALALDWNRLLDPARPWRFVANVPYYVTGPLLVRALEHEPAFRRIVVMVQKEVADRLRAGPGDPAYGALSVLAAYYARVEDGFDVSPACFWPRPEVTSSVVALVPAGRRTPPPAVFFPVVRAAFGRRRKTLRNALTDDPHLGLDRRQAEEVLARAGIDPGARGETLGLEEFARLAAAVQELHGRIAGGRPAGDI